MSEKQKKPGSVVDLERELTDIADEEARRGGFITGAVVEVRKWDDVSLRPLELRIRLTNKMGEGMDAPYSERPPDDELVNILKKHGWVVEREGTMLYGILCDECGYVARDEEVRHVRGGRKCPRCGSIGKMRVLKGAKWIHGYKTVKLEKGENREKLRTIVKKLVSEVGAEWNRLR